MCVKEEKMVVIKPLKTTIFISRNQNLIKEESTSCYEWIKPFMLFCLPAKWLDKIRQVLERKTAYRLLLPEQESEIGEWKNQTWGTGGDVIKMSL